MQYVLLKRDFPNDFRIENSKKFSFSVNQYLKVALQFTEKTIDIT